MEENVFDGEALVDLVQPEKKAYVQKVVDNCKLSG